MPFLKAPCNVGRDADFNTVGRRDIKPLAPHIHGYKALPFGPIVNAGMVWNVVARNRAALKSFHVVP